jgi:release factor glutamine methyltransferase
LSVVFIINMPLKDTIQQILSNANRRLTDAGCDTPRLDAELLLAHTLHKNRTWLYTRPETSLTNEQVAAFETLLRRREQREPVAYLTGHREFYGLDFLVNSNVLIPRPETELLVETAIQLSKTMTPPLSIADIGTGSGCIAIALVKNIPNVHLYAVDVSEKALLVAQQNARQNDVTEQITFLQGNLLTPLTEPVDMIVSNPPYVSKSELGGAMPEVKQYESALALDGGEDGLDVIQKLLSQAGEKLNPGGSVLVEIGAFQGAAVARLAQELFPNSQIEIKQDLAGLDRLLVVKPENV